MRLVGRRMAAAPGVPAALAVVLLLVAVAVPLAALAGRSLLAGAVTRSVAASPPTGRAVEVSVRLDRADPATQDARVGRHLADALRGTGATVVRVHTGELLAPVTGVSGGARLVPWSSPDLVRRARLTAGRWPASGAAAGSGAGSGTGAAGPPVEAAVQADAAARAGLKVGTRLRFGRPAAGEQQLPDLVVVGLWRVTDPQDAAWFGSSLELTGAERAGVYGPVAVDPAGEARIPVTWTARWRAVPDPARIAPSALPALAARVGALPSRLTDVPTAGAAAPAVDGSLAATLDGQRVLRDRTVGAVGVLLSALLALGVAALLLAAALLVELRAADDRVLRVRGAGPGQRARTALAEPLLLAVPVAAVAVPAAGWAVARLVDGAGLGRVPGSSPAAEGVLLAVLVTAVLASLLLAAAVQLGLRSRFREVGAARAGATTAAAEQARSSRAGRVASGLALLAVVALAGWQLYRATGAGTPAGPGIGGAAGSAAGGAAGSAPGGVAAGVDPVLLVAPAALLVAAAALAVRGLRVALAPLGVLAGSRRLGPALLGRRLSRSAVRPVVPVVALLAAVAAGVCAVAADRGTDRVLRAQAVLALGAEQVVTAPRAPGAGAELAGPQGQDPGGTGGGGGAGGTGAQAGALTAQVRTRLAAVPGVTAVSPVRRVTGTAGGRPVELLAADSAGLGRIDAGARAATGAPAGVAELPARLLGPLAELQRRPGGLALPAGATGLQLTGRVLVQAFGTSPLPADTPVRVVAVLAGQDGLPVRVPFSPLPADQSSGTATARLPAALTGQATGQRGIRLVGLDLIGPVLPDFGDVVLRLTRAAAVTGSGPVELTAPQAWVPAPAGLDGTADGSTSTQAGRELGQWLSADLLIAPAGAAPTAVRLAADPAPAPVLPALVERGLAAGLGLARGDRFAVDRGDRRTELKVAGILDRLPGKGSGAPDGILVDLAALSRADVAAAGQAGVAPAPREWWVAGRPRAEDLVTALQPLRDKDAGPPVVTTATADLAARRADPWTAGLVALLRLLPWLLGAGALAALVLGAVVAARGRRDDVAGLLAVGASRGQVGRWVAIEQLIVGAAVVLLGGLLGAAAARLVVPLLAAPVTAGAGDGLDGALLAGRLGVPPAPTGAVLAAAGLLVLLTALLQAAAARRVPVTAVLREGTR